MAKQSFLKGTFILIIAGLITKILGVVNKIVIARIMGDEGVGLYMMAYPTLILVVTLTQLGLPVAISKHVSEANAQNDRRRIKKILTVSILVVGVLSVVFTVAMMTLAPLLAHILFTDPRTLYPLMAISPIVPIVGISSILRGYFQGMQNMKPYALSQVIEQTVRVSLVAFLTTKLLPYGVEYAASGAMIAGVIGELISLIYMLTMFKKNKAVKIRKKFWAHLKGGRTTFNQLMRIALPTTGSRLIGSLSYFFEPIVVAQSLALAGIATKVATAQYGELAGYAIPLLFLPTFITHALHVNLVPAISEANARHQMNVIFYRLHQALKIAMMAGGISIIISFSFARPVLELMYHAPQAAIYVKVMAPLFLFFYFQGPLQATLQALDLANAAMINSLIGSVVKIIAMFALASRPELGIMGAALAYVVGVVLVTLLHLATVIKAVGFSLIYSDYIKGILCIVASTFLGDYLMAHFIIDWPLLPRTITLISIVLVVYLILIFSFKIIKKEELKQFPIIGRLL